MISRKKNHSEVSWSKISWISWTKILKSLVGHEKNSYFPWNTGYLKGIFTITAVDGSELPLPTSWDVPSNPVSSGRSDKLTTFTSFSVSEWVYRNSGCHQQYHHPHLAGSTGILPPISCDASKLTTSEAWSLGEKSRDIPKPMGFEKNIPPGFLRWCFWKFCVYVFFDIIYTYYLYTSNYY